MVMKASHILFIWMKGQHLLKKIMYFFSMLSLHCSLNVRTFPIAVGVFSHNLSVYLK